MVTWSNLIQIGIMVLTGMGILFQGIIQIIQLVIALVTLQMKK